jgi:hypothetical protein
MTIINRKAYDFTCVELHAKNKRYLGISAINYEHGLEPKRSKGTHSQDLGRSTGDYSTAGSLTIDKQDAELIRADLGDGYMEEEFFIVVNYAKTGMPVITDELLGVRIKKESDAHSKGGDTLSETWELDILEVVKNGKHAVKAPLYGY